MNTKSKLALMSILIITCLTGCGGGPDESIILNAAIERASITRHLSSPADHVTDFQITNEWTETHQSRKVYFYEFYINFTKKIGGKGTFPSNGRVAFVKKGDNWYYAD